MKVHGEEWKAAIIKQSRENTERITQELLMKIQGMKYAERPQDKEDEPDSTRDRES